MAEAVTTPLIRVENLYKLFGPNPAKFMPLVHKGLGKDEILAQTGHTLGLRDINLSIGKGEIYVIMGLSGSGKSTLIRHFNRLIDPTEGRILVEGTDVMGLGPKEMEQFRRHKMSMVFQRFGLMPHRTVVENVSYGLTVQGVSRGQRLEKARKWLDAVGLGGYENQYPSQLSGGQQQRVGLARALCTDAEILLMDEAFSALDPLIRSEMQDQLIELQKKLHKTIIFITHDLDEALRIGDKIAILKDGKLVQEGVPVDILLKPADAYVEAFVRDVNRARALHVGAVMQPPACRITAGTAGEALAQLRASSSAYGYYCGNGSGCQGVLTQQALEAAAAKDAQAKVENGLLEPAHAVAVSDLLEAVIPETLENRHPLAVLDADGQLQGELSRSSLAQVLGAAREQRAAASGG